MTKNELEKTANSLLKILLDSGYNLQEAASVLVGVGDLIKERTDAKSEKNNRKQDSRVLVCNERLSTL